PLAVDPDLAPVAEAFEVFGARVRARALWRHQKIPLVVSSKARILFQFDQAQEVARAVSGGSIAGIANCRIAGLQDCEMAELNSPDFDNPAILQFCNSAMPEGVNFRVIVDLDQLREFAAIAESGSFSKAARRLRIAQPPLSRHIRRLEQELGVKLFVRTATGVEITPEGSLLLAQARVVLDDTSALLELASRTKLGLASTIRVAMAPGLCEAVNRIRVHLVAGTTQLAIEGTDMPSSSQYEALR